MQGLFAECRGVDRRDGLERLLAVRGGEVLSSIRWGAEEDDLGCASCICLVRFVRVTGATSVESCVNCDAGTFSSSQGEG
jgi:hypothetical protein